MFYLLVWLSWKVHTNLNASKKAQCATLIMLFHSTIFKVLPPPPTERSTGACAQWPPTLCNPIDCSPPGSSGHGIFHQEYWSGLPFPPSGDLPYPGTEPISCISCMGRQILYTVTTWEAIKSILALKKCRMMFKNKKSFIIPFSPSREIRFVYSLNSLFLD